MRSWVLDENVPFFRAERPRVPSWTPRVWSSNASSLGAACAARGEGRQPDAPELDLILSYSPPLGYEGGPTECRTLPRTWRHRCDQRRLFLPAPQPLSVAKLVFARTTPPALRLLAWIRLITKSETHVLKRLVVCFQFTTWPRNRLHLWGFGVVGQRELLNFKETRCSCATSRTCKRQGWTCA